MNVNEILTHAVVLLGGGGIGSIAMRLIDRRDRREASEIDRLRDDHRSCEDRCDGLESELELLKVRLRAVEVATPSYLARWIKGQDKRLIWLNDRSYATMFAPFGWSREDVLNKTFEELFGEGGEQAVRLIAEMDRAALENFGKTQSMTLQLHPRLPVMTIIKVAYVAGDNGQLHYEGVSFVPSNFADEIGAYRTQMAIAEATVALANKLDRKDGA